MRKRGNKANSLKLGENDFICPSCNMIMNISNELHNDELVQCPKCEIAIKNPFFKKINNTSINNYSDIDKALKKLIDSNGHLIISISDYYIQFAHNYNSHLLDFEAVSHNFIPKIGHLTSKFQELLFQIDQNSNYYKVLNLNKISTKKIIREIEKIFVELYGIPFIHYQLDLEIDNVEIDNIVQNVNVIKDEPYTKNTYSNESLVLSKKHNNWIAGIVIFIILMIIGYVAGNSSSSSSISLYTVNTTTYVATSKSTFDGMFRYINDGDNQSLLTLISYGQVQKLSPGTKVNLISSHFSYCVVQLKGSSRKIWIVTDHITKDY